MEVILPTVCGQERLGHLSCMWLRRYVRLQLNMFYLTYQIILKAVILLLRVGSIPTVSNSVVQLSRLHYHICFMKVVTFEKNNKAR